MRSALALEFLSLFIALPAALAIRPLPWWPLPLLWLVTLYCYWILRRQPEFDWREFWRTAAIAPQRRSILVLFVPAAALLTLAVYLLRPDLFLSMPRDEVLLWCSVMLLYPVFSVVPQTVVYRAFVFNRYRPLFPGRTLILASAVAFSWLHIVLRNPLAPLLTFPAGLLFAWRYSRTDSVLVSAFEHALYGCLIFTVGLGAYFYTGAVR